MEMTFRVRLFPVEERTRRLMKHSDPGRMISANELRIDRPFRSCRLRVVRVTIGTSPPPIPFGATQKTEYKRNNERGVGRSLFLSCDGRARVRYNAWWIGVRRCRGYFFLPPIVHGFVSVPCRSVYARTFHSRHCKRRPHDRSGALCNRPSYRR